MWLVAVLVCLVTGGLAARKGYNFFLWVLAGGVIGLLILMFLPFTNNGDFPDEQAKEKRKTGNIIGGVISAFAVMVLVFRLTNS